MTRNYIWSHVRIEPGLGSFGRLSPEDVYELILQIKGKRDPVPKLSQLVNERGRARRDEHRKRIADHARKIRKPDSWEGPHLNLITQPWVTELCGDPQFARIFADAPLTVRVKSNGEPDTTFASAEELLQIWRLD